MTVSTFEPGILQHVPPGELLLERNIRDSQPDAALVASVKDLGVLQPITAVLNTDGKLVVRYGHKRTLAAVEAGTATIPVYIAGDDDTADKAEIDRIIRQRDENTRRAGLTAADDLHVYEQLTAFGLSPAQISKRTRTKRDTIDTALKVIGSEVARDAAAAVVDLTLDQAAAIAEFDDDAEVVEVLTTAAVQDPSQFAHIAQRARDDRRRKQQHAELVAQLEESGVTVVERPNHDSQTWRLERLRDDKNKPIKLEAHQACPGHVAWLESRWAMKDGRRVDIYEPEYGCADPKKNGHRDAWASSSGGSKPKAADMSEDEREKAKAARRLVIDNNKAWDSAAVVRSDWLAEFAKRKTAPKGAAAFLAKAIVSDLHHLYSYNRPKAAEWLGITDGELATVLETATEGRALQIALVQVLARYEDQITRDAWRENGKTSKWGRYLRFLESAGYGLSDVEKFAISSKTA